YLKELVQRGHSLEYFIEGGRSRTGLLLPAKPGMLSMTVQAYLREPVRPVQFVPIYFGYEKLLEGRSFTNELAGGKKRKESLLGLFKALKTLRENYGRVYVSIGEPIALNTLLDKSLPTWKNATFRENNTSTDNPATTNVSTDQLIRSDYYRHMVTTLGKQILTNINAAVSVTPVSLVASLLLAAPGKSSGHSELRNQLELTHKLLSTLHLDTQPQPINTAESSASIILPDLNADAWIEHTTQLGFLKFDNSELGQVVKVKPRHLTTLMYFCNNILHIFVVPSLIACVLTQQRSVSRARLERLVLQAWPVLSAQYYLDQQASQHIAQNAIAAMEKNGLLDIESNRVQRPSGRSLQSVLLIRLATLVRPTIERGYLAAALLAEFRGGISVEEYEQRYRIAANRFAMTEARDPNELYNRASFQTLVDSLLATDAVENHDGNLRANSVLQSLEFEIRQVLADATRHEMLAAARLAAHCTLNA
ncbi:MAG: 1-acyl-sn-glycerol-3-phosphate acyltransferase, partial [Pseudomonadota bacterium]